LLRQREAARFAAWNELFPIERKRDGYLRRSSSNTLVELT
jgi:hypothetical protein